MNLKQNHTMIKEYPILQHFQYAHLPEHLRVIARPWHALAWKMARTLPHNAETSTALQKLLEGKDAAVKAVSQY